MSQDDKNFWQEIKDFFANAANKVVSYFRRVRRWLRAHLDDIIDIVEFFKKIVRHPLTIGFVKWTDVKWDDAVRQKLEELIPFWVERLELIDNINDCLDKPTVGEKMDCIIEALRKVDRKYQNELFKQIAYSMATDRFDSENVSYDLDDLDQAIEGAYSTKKMAEKNAGTDE